MNRTSSPISSVGSFEWGRAILARIGHLAHETIASLLEHNPGTPLPDDLCAAAVSSLRKQNRRGRKLAMGTARLDFIIAEAWDLYEQKRAEYRAAAREARREARSKGILLPRADKSPSERALEFVLEQMKSDFGPISTSALRNLLSACKRIGDWEPPDS
jgi:hypothetical protein